MGLESGEDSRFEIGSPVYDSNNNVITVVMTLKDAPNYTNYPALKAGVESVGDDEILGLKVSGIKVADDIAPGQYTISGTVSGRMYFNQQVDFPVVSYIDEEIIWTGEQTSDGADSVAPDGINLTVEVD